MPWFQVRRVYLRRIVSARRPDEDSTPCTARQDNKAGRFCVSPKIIVISLPYETRLYAFLTWETGLTKDYAKSKKTKRGKIPAGWMWLFMGAFLGCFISVLIFISKINHNNVAEKADKKTQENANVAAIDKAAPPKEEQPKFTFHKDLEQLKLMADDINAFFPERQTQAKKAVIPFVAPNSLMDPERMNADTQNKVEHNKTEHKAKKVEIKTVQVIPEKVLAMKHSPTAKEVLIQQALTQQTINNPDQKTEEAIKSNLNKSSSKVKTLLQVGSFRLQKEADRRRAELIMLGYTAQIQIVSLNDGEKYHRVVIPFENEQALKQAQKKLEQSNISTKPQAAN